MQAKDVVTWDGAHNAAVAARRLDSIALINSWLQEKIQSQKDAARRLTF